VHVLARVDWNSFKWEPEPLGYYYLNTIAYGKLEVREWETRKQEIGINSTEQLNYLLGCLMLSAVNEDRVHAQHQSTSSVTVRAPLDFVRKVLATGDNFEYDYRILWSFIAELSREELLDWARMRTKEPVLLSDLPSVWELFFHPEKGIAIMKRENAFKVLNENGALEMIFQDLFKSDDPSLSPEDELRRVFCRERGLVREELVKEAMIEYNVLDIIIAQRASDLWLQDVQLGRSYIMGIVQLYLDIFQGKLNSWVRLLAERVPVQLLVITEEKMRRRSEEWQQEWGNLLKIVQKCIRDQFCNKLTLNTIRIQKQFVKYNRECDWYKLFMVVLNESPEMKRKIPGDYANRTKVYRIWLCSFYRVCIRLFGEEETRKQADKILENGFSLWDRVSREMKDGELLHIAVELGSLAGVKWTAYPKTLTWRNADNRTALEYAEEKLDKGHEVTEYLGRVVGNMTLSGFYGS